jgi:hypothetical protein
LLFSSKQLVLAGGMPDFFEGKPSVPERIKPQNATHRVKCINYFSQRQREDWSANRH